MKAKSIGAVAAGFAAVVVLSTLGDAVMHAAGVFPALGERMSDALFAWALLYRTLFTVLGGFVTAKLAPENPRRHVAVLATLGTLAGAVGVVVQLTATTDIGPAWYPIALAVLAAPSVWAGGALARPAARHPAMP